jgi:hypothetical protein
MQQNDLQPLDGFASMAAFCRGVAMPKVDFAKAKADIAEIVDIVKAVPEGLQQRCFELLFELAFSESKPSAPLKAQPAETEPKKAEKEKPSTGKKLPGNVLAFLHRCDLTEAHIGKLFMLDHDPLLPVYKISDTSNLSKKQIEKIMMVLLENGLLSNSLSAPYSELRDVLRDDGLWDGNTNKTLKRNHVLFRGAITEEGIDESQSVELTGEGYTRLAEIVRELASEG